MVFMTMSFEEQVRAEFAEFIADGRLRVVDARFDPKSFGNASVTMAGGGILVRLVTDRADIYGDIARESQPDQWYPLQHAIAAIRGGEPSGGPFSVQGFSAELRQYWPHMVEAFGPGWDSTKGKIARAVEASNARFLEEAKRISARARRGRRGRK
jgi:hypothetical protein